MAAEDAAGESALQLKRIDSRTETSGGAEHYAQRQPDREHGRGKRNDANPNRRIIAHELHHEHAEQREHREANKASHRRGGYGHSVVVRGDRLQCVLGNFGSGAMWKHENVEHQVKP